jgi:hypothetical protein
VTDQQARRAQDVGNRFLHSRRVALGHAVLPADPHVSRAHGFGRNQTHAGCDIRIKPGQLLLYSAYQARMDADRHDGLLEQAGQHDAHDVSDLVLPVSGAQVRQGRDHGLEQQPGDAFGSLLGDHARLFGGAAQGLRDLGQCLGCRRRLGCAGLIKAGLPPLLPSRVAGSPDVIGGEVGLDYLRLRRFVNAAGRAIEVEILGEQQSGGVASGEMQGGLHR